MRGADDGEAGCCEGLLELVVHGVEQLLRRDAGGDEASGQLV